MNRLCTIARAAALALGLTAAALSGAQAQTFNTTGGTSSSLVGVSGTFNPTWFGGSTTYSALFDLNNLLTGGLLVLDAPAKLTFSLAGFEASYNNAFVAGGSRLDNRVNGTSALGSAFSFDQLTSGALDFGFLSNGIVPLAGNGTRQTGLMLSADRREALILFNDSFLGDRDFDDMVIRVSISPVPEPETALLWLAGLAGLGGWLRHRRSSKKVSPI